MNSGIVHVEEYESAGPEAGHSYQWWQQTYRMMERGWRLFCKKRHWKVQRGEWKSFAEISHSEVAEALNRRGE